MRGRIKAAGTVVSVGALIVIFSGCTGLKPGSLSLTQPAGIGAAHLRFTFCTLQGEEKEGTALVFCGSEAETEGKGQMLVGLVAPTGTTLPASLTVTPGPGAGATTMTRNQEVSTAYTKLLTREAKLPTGFEVAGYLSGTITEPVKQEVEWTFDSEIGLPKAADGGSYGGPLKLAVLGGWRQVNAELPASRPVGCSGENGEETETVKGTQAFCALPEAGNEALLGVSDLKISPPPVTTAAPGETVKLPFSFDFASTATVPPSFKLGATSSLRGAAVSLSNGTFSRGGFDPTTHRAPPTVKKAIVQVPKTALPGSFQVTLTAKTPQGGTVTAVAALTIKAKGRVKLKVPNPVKATLASGPGVPLQVTVPLAQTKVIARLFGPRPSGHGKLLLSKATAASKRPETLKLRLRLRQPTAAALLAAGAKLRLELKVLQPGSKPVKLSRQLRLR